MGMPIGDVGAADAGEVAVGEVDVGDEATPVDMPNGLFAVELAPGAAPFGLLGVAVLFGPSGFCWAGAPVWPCAG